MLRRHAPKLAASAAITIGLIVAIHRGGIELIPQSGDFSTVRWWILPVYLTLFLAMTWFRAVRWRALLRPVATVPRRQLFAISCAGFLAILALPFRLGELARPYLLVAAKPAPAPGRPRLGLGAALSSIVAERVIDGLFLSVVLAAALLAIPTIEPLPERVVGLPVAVAHVRATGWIMLGVFSAALVAIAVFYFARDFAVAATHAVLRPLSARLAARLAGMISRLADGLHAFGDARDAGRFLAETATYWGLNAVGMWVLAWGCGVVHADGSPMTLGESAALMGLLGCAILIPGPPGLLGVFQAGLYAGMTMYFPAHVVTGPGAAYVFLLYSSQVIATFVLGAWGTWAQGGAQVLVDALAQPAQRGPEVTPARSPLGS